MWLFLAGVDGWNVLLGDADAGWHIRTGEYVLDHHAVPTQDLFSFTKQGASWFAWEWLSDIAYAGAFRLAGLKGVVLLAGVLIALFATVLLRHIFWRGVNAFIALPLALLVVGSSSMHFLARPHLFTLLLLAAALWLLEADRRHNSAWVWALVPVTVLWTNLHGGFAIFLVCLGLLVAGSAVEAMLLKTGWNNVRRYSFLLVGCTAATLVNPYGIGLHRHIFEYLRSDWIRNTIQEFQAPTFRTEGQLQFEILLIGGILVAAMMLRKCRITEALWILFLGHAALNSVRHAPVFAVVAAPIIAEELHAMWAVRTRNMKRGSIVQTLHQIGADLSPAFGRSTFWIGVVVIVLAITNSPLHWPQDFPKIIFPVDVVASHPDLLRGQKVLTTDQWGDYLIYRFYPEQRVYVDGRSDFYGESLGKEYLHVLQLSSEWNDILTRRGFSAVLLPPEWPLVEMLKRDSGWQIVMDTGKALLFLRRQTQPNLVLPKQTAGSSRTKENPVQG
ncbi:MAG TPA: hypothetical protein VKU01_14585 [Bryobacteraceae bacterium]|nr:hypothetical protein [Bryobacteraceae bacterium]